MVCSDGSLFAIFQVECGVERAVSMGCSYTEERRHRTLLWDEDNARESGTHWGFVVIVSVYFTVNKCTALHSEIHAWVHSFSNRDTETFEGF